MMVVRQSKSGIPTQLWPPSCPAGEVHFFLGSSPANHGEDHQDDGNDKVDPMSHDDSYLEDLEELG